MGCARIHTYPATPRFAHQLCMRLSDYWNRHAMKINAVVSSFFAWGIFTVHNIFKDREHEFMARVTHYAMTLVPIIALAFTNSFNYWSPRVKRERVIQGAVGITLAVFANRLLFSAPEAERNMAIAIQFASIPILIEWTRVQLQEKVHQVVRPFFTADTCVQISSYHWRDYGALLEVGTKRFYVLGEKHDDSVCIELKETLKRTANTRKFAYFPEGLTSDRAEWRRMDKDSIFPLEEDSNVFHLSGAIMAIYYLSDSIVDTQLASEKLLNTVYSYPNFAKIWLAISPRLPAAFKKQAEIFDNAAQGLPQPLFFQLLCVFDELELHQIYCLLGKEILRLHLPQAVTLQMRQDAEQLFNKKFSCPIEHTDADLRSSALGKRLQSQLVVGVRDKMFANTIHKHLSSRNSLPLGAAVMGASHVREVLRELRSREPRMQIFHSPFAWGSTREA